MKVPNRIIWSLFPRLMQVSGKNVGGVKASYGLARAIANLRPVFDAIEGERVKLVKSHAVLDKDGEPELSEDGTSYNISDQKKFDEELTALMEIEDSHRVYQVSIEAFGDTSQLLPADFNILLELDIVLEGDAETK